MSNNNVYDSRELNSKLLNICDQVQETVNEINSLDEFSEKLYSGVLENAHKNTTKSEETAESAVQMHEKLHKLWHQRLGFINSSK